MPPGNNHDDMQLTNAFAGLGGELRSQVAGDLGEIDAKIRKLEIMNE